MIGMNVCVTIVDPAMDIFEIEEIPTIVDVDSKGTINKISDKKSTHISRIAYKELL